MTAPDFSDSGARLGVGIRVAARVLGALLLAGCDSAGDDAASAGAAGGPIPIAGSAGSEADGGGATSALVGSFLVKLVPAKGTRAAYTSFLGKLLDAPEPPLVPLVLDSEEGACRLLVPKVPFCDPKCDGTLCSADDVCTPRPTAQNAGTVQVEGLGEPFALEPVGGSMTYMPAKSLAYPPCAEGEPIRVQADAFTLEAECVAPLVLSGSDPIPVRTGEPVEIAWIAGAAETARVRIVLDIAHHGGQKGEIDCEVPDTGSFSIPQALVTKLVNLGVAGFPTVMVSRVTTAASSAAPDVTLTVASEVERNVDTGIASCSSDADCPDGMTCRVSHYICVE